MQEEWRDVKGLEGLYKVSNSGAVFSIKANKLMAQFYTKKGYKHLMLRCPDGIRRHFSVHRLVAEAFIPNPTNLEEVNHLNMKRDDNRASNLEWCTHLYNVNYGDAKQKRQQNSKCRAVVQCDLLTGEPLKVFHSLSEAARATQQLNSTILRACTGYFKQAGGYKWRYADV